MLWLPNTLLAMSGVKQRSIDYFLLRCGKRNSNWYAVSWRFLTLKVM